MMYESWIILTACLVGMTCGVVGCYLIVRKMAMIADAISHSVLLGIVLAFLISQSLNGTWMLLGAMIIGLVTTVAIQWFIQNGVPEDAAIGIVFTTFFSIGVILVTIFAKDVHLDVNHALMGEISFIPWNTISFLGFTIPKATFILLLVAIIVVIVVTGFYKELKITSFDPKLALAIGLPVSFIHYVLMSLVSVTAVASFDAVGAILVVSMLITPGASAYLMTERFSRMLLLSMAYGVMSALVGYYGASILDVSISGSMAVAGACLFIVSWIFSPKQGLLRRLIKWNQSSKSSITS
ncbi:metal ABC transporter permease [Mangrovibacillus cuniculi]|uniref:Metal ABC transporter permease n=1 Tax=Mangrovibacillus cuniculi TaxID=2593652 RepID=A0A7S8CAX6_9BACI|nr:metal ABC transporter permease [Mangrovibacillus cuniculi]QPC46636.1 metal ABC transporter permease [Mangrovibacillus cuniculi]